MRVKLHQEDLQEILFEQSYPKEFLDAQNGIVERNHGGEFAIGRADYKEIYFDQVHVGYGQMLPNQRTQIHFESDFESVELHFALEGSISSILENGLEFSFDTNQHNILYANGARGASNWNPQRSSVFEINLCPKFFRSFLPNNNPHFDAFHELMERKVPGAISPVNYAITPEMLLIINEIISCKRTGMYKKIFFEAKVLEILLLQLEQFGNSSTYRPSHLKKADVDKMYEVKHVLDQNLNGSYRLKDLAKLVGTNEFYLKSNFKEMFGTTVFDYWHHAKMTHAKKLILFEGMSVKQASELVGYTHPHHFSTAFKKKFGTTPGKLRC